MEELGIAQYKMNRKFTEKFAEISPEDRQARHELLTQWWTESQNLYKRCAHMGFGYEHVYSMSLPYLSIRPGVKEMFKLCEGRGIELVIVSAGLENVIESMVEFLLNAKPKHIRVIANRLFFDVHGVISGWDRNIIHSENKHEFLREYCPEYFSPEKLAQKRRVLIYGDSEQDAHILGPNYPVEQVKICAHPERRAPGFDVYPMDTTLMRGLMVLRCPVARRLPMNQVLLEFPERGIDRIGMFQQYLEEKEMLERMEEAEIEAGRAVFWGTPWTTGLYGSHLEWEDQEEEIENGDGRYEGWEEDVRREMAKVTHEQMNQHQSVGYVNNEHQEQQAPGKQEWTEEQKRRRLLLKTIYQESGEQWKSCGIYNEKQFVFAADYYGGRADWNRVQDYVPYSPGPDYEQEKEQIRQEYAYKIQRCREYIMRLRNLDLDYENNERRNVQNCEYGQEEVRNDEECHRQENPEVNEECPSHYMDEEDIEGCNSGESGENSEEHSGDDENGEKDDKSSQSSSDRIDDYIRYMCGEESNHIDYQTEQYDSEEDGNITFRERQNYFQLLEGGDQNPDEEQNEEGSGDDNEEEEPLQVAYYSEHEDNEGEEVDKEKDDGDSRGYVSWQSSPDDNVEEENIPSPIQSELSSDSQEAYLQSEDLVDGEDGEDHQSLDEYDDLENGSNSPVSEYNEHGGFEEDNYEEEEGSLPGDYAGHIPDKEDEAAHESEDQETDQEDNEEEEESDHESAEDNSEGGLEDDSKEPDELAAPVDPYIGNIEDILLEHNYARKKSNHENDWPSAHYDTETVGDGYEAGGEDDQEMDFPAGHPLGEDDEADHKLEVDDRRDRQAVDPLDDDYLEEPIVKRKK